MVAANLNAQINILKMTEKNHFNMFWSYNDSEKNAFYGKHVKTIDMILHIIFSFKEVYFEKCTFINVY